MTRDEMLTGLATGEIQPIIHPTIARTRLTDKDITHDEVAQRRRELINEPDDTEAPEWDGEGYPPNGTLCEALIRNESIHIEWTSGVVSEPVILPNNHFGRIFVASGRYHVICSPSDFRPIRTPEQRAEDEAVDAMIEALRDFPREKQEGRSKGVCRRLYRAGYRKQGSSNE